LYFLQPTHNLEIEVSRPCTLRVTMHTCSSASLWTIAPPAHSTPISECCNPNYIYIKSWSDSEAEEALDSQYQFCRCCRFTSNYQRLHPPTSWISDYDGTGKALSAMCEIASEACSAWFPQSDN